MKIINFINLFIVLSLCLVVACSDDKTSTQETCGVVGATQSCICSNGVSGSQSCLSGGSWGICLCDGTESDATTTDILLVSDSSNIETCDPAVESNCFEICSDCETDESSENPYTEDPNFDTNIDLGGADPSRLSYGSVTGTYRGVSSYSNYVSCSNSPSCYYGVGDGRVIGTYGYQYQCVEYVVRFFAQALNYSGLNGNGNAKIWWYNPQKAAGQDLLRFANGGSTPPQPGDAIVFDSSGVGHIAVIREVGSDYIRIIQQNWTHNSAEGNLRINMTVSNGTYFVQKLGSTGYPVLGWLRVPSCSPEGYLGCGGDGNVHHYDGCGTEGTTYETCSSTESCVASGDSASCVSICPNGNGDYCGESVGQTVGALYSCVNGTYTLKTTCEEGCSTRPSGENDVCNESNCLLNYNQGCDSGAVYNYDSCGNRGTLVSSCNANENCVLTGSGSNQTASCEQAACTPICNPGAKQCSGLTVEVCSADGCNWQTDHTCSGTCNAGRCCDIERVYPTSSNEYTDTCIPGDKAIWRGKSTDPVGNNATLTFDKCPSGGGPSASVTYWVVTGVDYPTDNPLNMCIGSIGQTCNNSSSTCCRTSGTWLSSESSKSVTVNLWPNVSDISPSRAGETKSLYIQTGGSDNPNTYWWHQGHAMKFEIICDP